MDYIYQKTTERLRQFVRILFSRNFAYAKFRENKTLAKISEFTVMAACIRISTYYIIALYTDLIPVYAFLSFHVLFVFMFAMVS